MKYLLMMLIALTLTGCNKPTSLRMAQVSVYADQQCIEHKGVYTFKYSPFYNGATVYCNDGTRTYTEGISKFTHPDIAIHLANNKK